MQTILLYWFVAQQQTSTLIRQKFGLLYAKFSAEFNEIGLFFLKATGRSWKMAKTKVIRTNANKRRLETEGCAAPKKRSFVFFDSFSLSNTKRLKMKAFLVVSLVSLRDRSKLCEKPPKESSFVLLSFFFTFECKKIENESISGSKFSFINS